MTSASNWTNPDQRELARSPLVNVIWQVRFTSVSKLADGRTALHLRDAVAPDGTLAPMPAPKFSVQMAAGGAQMPEQAFPEPGGQGWRISSSDSGTHVAINAGSLSIETTKYGTWSGHFFPWIERSLQALTDTGSPDLVLRLGMRYVNAIFGGALGREPFSDPTSLKGVIAPHLLGFLDHLDDYLTVESLQGRHLLKRGDQLSHVQHSLVTAENGEVGFLLDIDSYTERTAEFKIEDILDASNRLHILGLSLFQRCVTGEALDLMGPTGALK